MRRSSHRGFLSSTMFVAITGMGGGGAIRVMVSVPANLVEYIVKSEVSASTSAATVNELVPSASPHRVNAAPAGVTGRLSNSTIDAREAPVAPRC